MKEVVARSLHRMGVSADTLTIIGLLLAAAAGWMIFRSQLFLAGILLAVSGIFDMLDGAVARASGKSSRFGGILDSSLDRYGDGFVFGGIFFYAWVHARPDMALLALLSWIGAFSISYVRARAECEIGSCRVGFWERGERIGFLAAGLLAGNLAFVVYVLGLGTHWTVFQRMRLAQWTLSRGSADTAQLPGYLKPLSRSSGSYLIKVGLLIGILVGLKFLSS